MAKIGLTKLGLKKNTNLISLNWSDQVIEIKEYLPIEDKVKLIEDIVNYSLDANNFANPLRVDINLTLEIMFAYTNINFTEKQKEDRLALYDLLVSSGIWDAIKVKIVELDFIKYTVNEVLTEIYNYKTSVLGILQAVSEDYKDVELNAEKIREKLGNKENLDFLNNVMEKMG